ncbi:MAG: alpha/beta fold hydrolase [Dechloromonas sp.]|uniref:Alpha/beta fold hydrolase n=1 Tax=Candidatus Dechloromonas phosphorivorans TaxID=2899244 RepID=A0A9D7LTM3_9RHOO|nr:alpha/beta fold hydrolase [Candidatus Dechloromonas phosphorivorans]
MTNTEKISGIELFSCLPTHKTDRPPLLFIHGAFAGGWMWTDTFMPFLAKAGFPCYALSLRGHAGSDGRERLDWHSIADYVDDLTTVVDWLGKEPVLIGHSMGGFIVQKYLERHTAPAAVLLCSVPPQGLVAAQFHLLFRKPHLFMDLNSIMGGDHSDTSTLREALFAGEVDEAMLEIWLRSMQAESHQALWDMSMFNLPSLHGMNRPPMLILGAEHDVLVPAFLVQSTGQSYGLPVHIFRNMGHAVTHEKEWPLVAGMIGHWLDGQIVV